MNRQQKNVDVYRAIADPTRRSLIDLLAVRARTVGLLVDSVRLTQPAVSQHLKVLEQAGLVRSERQGRHVLYRLNAQPLEEVEAWAARQRRFWKRKLAMLGGVLDKQR